MRSFHSVISSVDMTNVEKQRILSCFNDSGSICAIDGFNKFAFRPGDQTLILRVADYINSTDLTSFNLGNPNAEFMTMSTIIGTFYIAQAKTTNKLIMAKLEGTCHVCIT